MDEEMMARIEECMHAWLDGCKFIKSCPLLKNFFYYSIFFFIRKKSLFFSHPTTSLADSNFTHLHAVVRQSGAECDCQAHLLAGCSASLPVVDEEWGAPPATTLLFSPSLPCLCLIRRVCVGTFAVFAATSSETELLSRKLSGKLQWPRRLHKTR